MSVLTIQKIKKKLDDYYAQLEEFERDMVAYNAGNRKDKPNIKGILPLCTLYALKMFLLHQKEPIFPSMPPEHIEEHNKVLLRKLLEALEEDKEKLSSDDYVNYKDTFTATLGHL